MVAWIEWCVLGFLRISCGIYQISNVAKHIFLSHHEHKTIFTFGIVRFRSFSLSLTLRSAVYLPICRFPYYIVLTFQWCFANKIPNFKWFFYAICTRPTMHPPQQRFKFFASDFESLLYISVHLTLPFLCCHSKRKLRFSPA